MPTRKHEQEDQDRKPAAAKKAKFEMVEQAAKQEMVAFMKPVNIRACKLVPANEKLAAAEEEITTLKGQVATLQGAKRAVWHLVDTLDGQLTQLAEDAGAEHPAYVVKLEAFTSMRESNDFSITDGIELDKPVEKAIGKYFKSYNTRVGKTSMKSFNTNYNMFRQTALGMKWKLQQAAMKESVAKEKAAKTRSRVLQGTQDSDSSMVSLETAASVAADAASEPGAQEYDSA